MEDLYISPHRIYATMRYPARFVLFLLLTLLAATWFATVGVEMKLFVSLLETFSRTAERLARNPLGIIALFIVLVYAMATGLLGFSNQVWLPSERISIIGFLILFPPTVFFTFIWLVVKHPEKLYAPSDFREDSSFLDYTDSSGHRRKIQSEAQLLVAPTSAGSSNIASTEETGLTDGGALERALLKNVNQTMIAKDLVLRDLEFEWGEPLRRGVKFATDDAAKPYLDLDAINLHPGEMKAIEVRLIHSIDGWGLLGASLICQAKEVARLLKRVRGRKEVNLLLLIVSQTDFTSEQMEKYRSSLRRGVADADVPTDVKIYSLNDLKQKYGIGEPETK